MQLRRLQLSLPDGAAVLSPALDSAVVEIGNAIADLRQIAAGVRPARLDDGFAAALRDLARSSPVPVDVEVPGDRVAASVEAAADFVAEGRTNAGIAKQLWLTEKTVETHVSSILGKLGLSRSAEAHRRVLAVLAYLRAVGAETGSAL